MEEDENKDAVISEEVKQEEIETVKEEVKQEETKTEEVKEESKKDEIKEEIKNETVKTAKEVKETIKNVDIKKDAKATTGFITEMVKKPLSRLKEIAEDKEHKDLKFAILLVIVWMIASGIVSLTGYYSFESFFKYNVGEHILTLLKVIIAPLLGLVVLSAIVFIMNKKNKKSFVTVFTALTAAKIPTIVVRVLFLLTLIGSSVTKLLNPVAYFANAISIVFTFFAIKALFGEEDNGKFLKIFVIVEAIYYIAYFVFSYMGIYI